MYMIAVQGVGGGRNRLCYRIMYWTQMGRVWKGYPPPYPSHGGDILEIMVLNTGLGRVINFKLTSNLARNVYDCSTRVGWGATVYV